MKEKRKRDNEQNPNLGRFNLTKQQLILARKFFLELEKEETEITHGFQYVMKKENK